MLTEIQCDQFLGGEPVRFKEGLNAVMGDGSARTGTSAFLRIIDFVFGGKDYPAAADILEQAGGHEIRFCFRFGEERFYFSRSVGKHAVVRECTDEYVPVSEMSLRKFRAFLSAKYGMDQTGASFREMTDGFFRLREWEHQDKEHSLKGFPGRGRKEGGRRLLRLFRKYDQVERVQADLAEEEKKARVYEDAFRCHYIPGVTGKSEYEKNRTRIALLSDLQEELLRQSSEKIWDEGTVQTERLAETKRNLRDLTVEEQGLRYQLEGIRADMELGEKNLAKDFDELLEFFPDADIRHLEEIEDFHRKLSVELRSVSDQMQDILRARLRLNSYMATLNRQEEDQAEPARRLSIPALKHYAELDREIRSLEAENEYYDRTREMRETAERLRKRLDALVGDITSELQDEINRELERLNMIICDGRRAAPSVTFSGMDGFTYCIPSDAGDSSQARGMLLFDLVILRNTVLPAVIHDSDIIRQAEGPEMVKILELYDSQKKQAFIAVDNGEEYSGGGTVPEVLKECVVLQLTHGHGLFGRSERKAGAG